MSIASPPSAAPAAAERATTVNGQHTGLFLAVLLCGHVLLALVMREYRAVAVAHCVTTVAVSLGAAFLSSRPEQLAFAAGYLCGSEVLWRMTGGAVFWEASKLALAVVMLVGFARFGGSPRRGLLTVIFLALLLPSTVLTFLAESSGRARELITANLGTPVALALSVLFFSSMVISPARLYRLLWWTAAPVVGIAVLAIRGLATSDSLVFGQESSAVASGGFGPNQVSAALSLGALMVVMLAAWRRGGERLLAGLLFPGFVILSVLTFSRGGLLNLAVPSALVALRSLRTLRSTAMMLVAAAVLLVAGSVLLPRLDDFTNGELRARYTDLASNRGELVRSDLELWRQHPVAGVGPGMAGAGRGSRAQPFAAHVEYSRLLAEHGLLGLGALLCLLAIVVLSYLAAPWERGRAMVLLLAGWAASEMAHSAMRLAAVALALGLMTVTIQAPARPADG